MANQLGRINHIVELMLENRSFDQMLGFLYPGGASDAGDPFDGLTGNETNPDDQGREIGVYKIQAGDPHPYLMPGADPGEGFYNTNFQLFETDDPAPGAQPTNRGFVVNFKSAIATDLAKHYKDTLPGTEPAQIMGMYPPEMLPILSGLAKGYAVCDRWFSSVPTMTMPNRAFALGGTSQGRLDDHVKTFTCPSIFGRLGGAGIPWGIFGYNRDPLTEHDFPDIQTTAHGVIGHFRDFKQHVEDNTLPAFSFLEPSWSSTGNSQHPNYNVATGEQLIHDVYYALRANPDVWASTLLVITYDEHGGNYDHVAPPDGATPPGDGTQGEFLNFDFTRLGVRVPAVLVSPLIRKGAVFRSGGALIDHTSVLKTISERWGTQTLTGRDAAAASLGDVLTEDAARVDDPIAGMKPPVATVAHPNASTPSHLDKVHAARVAALPLRSEQGHFQEAAPPGDDASAAEVSTFIRDRTAAWREHVRRRDVRRLRTKAQGGHR